MARTDNDLLREVNGSGFPLQIGVARLVRDSATGWDVRYTEHQWTNSGSTDSAFIDAVLWDRPRTTQLVLECKRVRDADWIFLRPANASAIMRAKVLLSYVKARHVLEGWEDVDAKLASEESEYCLMAGEGNATKPLLERIAANVVLSTEALYAEDVKHGMLNSEVAHCYVPVIVTTANLKSCEFEGSAIDVSDGTFKNATFRDLKFIRFRKQLSARPSATATNARRDPLFLARAKESTVFVVNVNNLKDFLHNFEVQEDSTRAVVYANSPT